MITINYGRLGLRAGDRVLDVGCGQGRHTYEALRRGASVVSLDLDRGAVKETAYMSRQLHDGGTVGTSESGVHGDANHLPFADASFDRVICSETLEHVPTDETAIAELRRVLRPGGRLAISVPRYFPERVCWTLSDEYHNTPGGHVRIYRADELTDRCEEAGLTAVGRHHAHALHSPYWWIRCAVGAPEEARLSRWYQRLLEWDLMNAPTAVGRLERLLDPVLGKSVVLYFDRHAGTARAAA